ncbi:MAG: DNA-processing protein DprA [Gallionella sp.]|nr:DNA-processing protein DprA [Gallionella sp.]MDD4958804.1 DNA-processing protein DprA [Gallionella sp.]
MKPSLLTLPETLRQRLDSNAPEQWLGMGNVALLDAPLLGFIASRECPGHVLLDTLERVPQWVAEQRVMISGFHSPLEQQVFRSTLRRKGRVVKVLARSLNNYRFSIEERESLAENLLLLISPFSAQSRRTTRESALARNRWVIALATEIVAPYVAANSPLSILLKSTNSHPNELTKP